MMEFYSETHLIARKEHRCEMCDEAIPVGTAYWRETGKFDGEFFTRRIHEHCYEMMTEYCAEVDTEFFWDDITAYVAEKHCETCEHSALYDEEEGWTECPYFDVTECEKLRNIYKSPEICAHNGHKKKV